MISRRQVLISVITVIFFFSSCSRVHYKSTGTGGVRENLNAGIFGDNFDKALYRAVIDMNDKHFSALMLIKKIPDRNSYRMVFLSEIGLKMLDMEFFNTKDNNFHVHYCLDAFDRRSIINSIKKDMESILMNYPKGSESKVFAERGSENKVIKYKLKGPGKCYYSLNNENRIIGIERRGVLWKKGDIALEYGSGSPPQEIFILHKLIDLEIVLTYLKI